MAHQQRHQHDGVMDGFAGHGFIVADLEIELVFDGQVARENITGTVFRVVREQLGLSEETPLALSHSFVQDLGADSLDEVELVILGWCSDRS